MRAKASFICSRGGCGEDIRRPENQDRHNQKVHNTCAGCTGKTVPPKTALPHEHTDESHSAVAGFGDPEDNGERMHNNLGDWPLGNGLDDDRTGAVADSEPVGTDYSGGRKKLAL
jgi:hypothetical protein